MLCLSVDEDRHVYSNRSAIDRLSVESHTVRPAPEDERDARERASHFEVSWFDGRQGAYLAAHDGGVNSVYVKRRDDSHVERSAGREFSVIEINFQNLGRIALSQRRHRDWERRHVSILNG